MRHYRDKRFWKLLFLSYVAILVFSLMIGTILFQSSLTRIEKDAERFSQISLSQVADSLGRLEEDLQALSNSFFARTEFQSLVYANEDLSTYKLERVAQLQEEINRQVSYNIYVSGIYIWFNKPHLAATTSGFFRTEESFNDMLQKEYGITMQDISSWLEGRNTIAIRPLGTSDAGLANRVLAATWADPAVKEGNTLILMSLNLNAVQELFSEDSGNDNAEVSAFFWAISKQDGTILAPKSTQSLATALSDKEFQNDSVAQFWVDGNSMVVMKMKAGEDFDVVAAYDLKSYEESRHQYIALGAIFLGIYLTLGIAMAFFLTRQNYQPIQKLNRLLLDKLDDTATDDFAMLEASIRSLLYSSQEYDHAKLQEEKERRNRCLIDLMCGEIGANGDFFDICQQYGLEFPSSRFVVVGITVTDYGNLFSEGVGQGREGTDIAMFAVSSIVEELLGELAVVYLCHQGNKIWVAGCPLPAKNLEAGDFHSQLMEACVKAESFIQEHLSMRTIFYVSRLSKSQGKADSALFTAFQEAKWGLEQMEGYSLSQVSDWESVGQAIRPSKFCPPDDMGAKRRELFSMVTSGNMETAQKILQELRQQDLTYSDGSFSTVRAQGLILIGFFVSHLPEKVAQNHQEELQHFREIISLETRDDRLTKEMREFMEFFHEIWSETENTQKAGKMDIAVKAAEFIIDHYTDPNLNVLFVAESLSVSTSYLSRVFREKYSMTLLEYIQHVRIDSAKVFLLESENTIETIAGLVGYSNKLSLIRVFRRLEDCTPTEYRKKAAQQSETSTKDSTK